MAKEAPVTFSNLRKWSFTGGKISTQWRYTGSSWWPFVKCSKKMKNRSCLHAARVVLSKRPQGAACFCFFCQHIHCLFFIFLASPVCQLRHTVEGLEVLVRPDRFVFAKVKLEADSVRQKKWFMIHLLHKSYLFIMNNTFFGAVG